MALRTPEPPKGGSGNTDASKNRNSPGQNPTAGAKAAPALGSLAGDDDDEDDAPKPPRPIRVTSQMKAVSIPPAASKQPPPVQRSGPPRPPPAPPKPPAAPPKPPAPKPAPPAPAARPSLPPTVPALPSLDEAPLTGEATVMMAQPVIPGPPAGMQPAARPNEVALPGLRGGSAPARKPAGPAPGAFSGIDSVETSPLTPEMLARGVSSSGESAALKGTAPQSLEDIARLGRSMNAGGPAQRGEATVLQETAPQSIEDIARLGRAAMGGQGAPTAAGLVAAATQAAGLYGGNNEATQMMAMPAVEEPAPNRLGPGQLPGMKMEGNSESTRISEGPIDFAAIARQMQAAGTMSSGGGGESTVMGESTQFGQPSKGKKKPVADVKARSKAVLAPIDPSRLLTQAEAAELKAAFSSGSNLDSFLAGGHGPQVVSTLADDAPQEGTMIGRFFGAFGIGENKPHAAAAPVGKDPAQEAWEAVRKAPLLNGLNPQFVTDAIKSGDLKLLACGRDMLVEMEGRAVLLLEGQIALARFKPDVLDRERRAQRAYRPGDKKAEKKEYNRRQEVGPMIRLCESNLGLFNEGDLVSVEAQGPEAIGLGAYSVTPIRALSISLARLDVWRRTYHFFGERVRRAADAARSRLAANTGARALVADFFVRHGLSVSMSLRVRELDKCIECYECEKACEQRYGAKRLSLNGKVLGALDFVDCCHTCVDQRCIDPCAYDSIKFDLEKKEVIISEDSCIGCSLCALACPYDAIEMHELDDKPLLKLRLEKDGKLAFGEGKPRKARLRRIASKCDHCINYEDQACISACPTGALLEIPPEAAFVERTEQMSDAAKGGFEHTVMFNPNEIFDPKKFYKGLSEEDDKGRAVEQKLNTTWLWVLGILGSLAVLSEIALRKLMPEWSGLFYYMTKYGGMEPELALENIEYKPTEALAQWLGYIGTVVMFASMFYSARKWLPFMRKVGAQRSWFDWHVWAGAIGPALVMMHTAGKLDNWVSVAVWSMVAAFFSGIVGRYISTVVPDLASQASLRVLDLERKMSELRNRHAGVNVADRFYEKLRRRYSTVADPGMGGVRAGITALWMYTIDAFVRPFRSTLLRLRLKGIKDPKARTRVAQVATELALIECRRMLLPKIEPMFREWKIIHIPFAIVLTIVAAIHIVNELFLKR
jgi:Fe-S-cluster-containing hydrogenase component 2